MHSCDEAHSGARLWIKSSDLQAASGSAGVQEPGNRDTEHQSWSKLMGVQEQRDRSDELGAKGTAAAVRKSENTTKTATPRASGS